MGGDPTPLKHADREQFEAKEPTIGGVGVGGIKLMAPAVQFAGVAPIPPLDSGAGVNALLSLAWVDPALAALDVASDAVAFLVDPIAAVAGSIAGYILEHCKPLQDALNMVVGDPPSVMATAADWDSVAARLDYLKNELIAVADRMVSTMRGETVLAASAQFRRYAAAAAGYANFIQGMAVVIRQFSVIVSTVQKFIKDAIADVVGSFISALIVEACSLGTATPAIVMQIATKVSMWVGRVAGKFKAIKSTVETVQKHLNQCAEALTFLDPNKAKLHLAQWAGKKGTQASQGIKNRVAGKPHTGAEVKQIADQKFLEHQQTDVELPSRKTQGQWGLDNELGKIKNSEQDVRLKSKDDGSWKLTVDDEDRDGIIRRTTSRYDATSGQFTRETRRFGEDGIAGKATDKSWGPGGSGQKPDQEKYIAKRLKGLSDD